MALVQFDKQPENVCRAKIQTSADARDNMTATGLPQII